MAQQVKAVPWGPNDLNLVSETQMKVEGEKQLQKVVI